MLASCPGDALPCAVSDGAVRAHGHAIVAVGLRTLRYQVFAERLRIRGEVFVEAHRVDITRMPYVSTQAILRVPPPPPRHQGKLAKPSIAT